MSFISSCIGVVRPVGLIRNVTIAVWRGFFVRRSLLLRCLGPGLKLSCPVTSRPAIGDLCCSNNFMTSFRAHRFRRCLSRLNRSGVMLAGVRPGVVISYWAICSRPSRTGWHPIPISPTGLGAACSPLRTGHRCCACLKGIGPALGNSSLNRLPLPAVCGCNCLVAKAFVRSRCSAVMSLWGRSCQCVTP